MQEFITGFVIALLVVIPVVILLMRRRSSRTRRSFVEHADQIEHLSKLTGGLAHEIKNPLSTVKINLKLVCEQLESLSLDAGNEDTEHKLSRLIRKIGVISKETDRVEQILEGFLRYVGRCELEFSQVDINSLVRDMADFYMPQAQNHSITIRLGLSEQPLICNIDEDMLKQVLLNLFINAQQAMSSGGELILTTEKLDDAVMIRVSDTGSGIAPDKVARIFDAYYSSRPHGSGLGLPTAKRIIDAHQGTITVDSEPGKGTSFSITLPTKAD